MKAYFFKFIFSDSIPLVHLKLSNGYPQGILEPPGPKVLAKLPFKLFLSTYLQIHRDQWYVKPMRPKDYKMYRGYLSHYF